MTILNSGTTKLCYVIISSGMVSSHSMHLLFHAAERKRVCDVKGVRSNTEATHSRSRAVPTGHGTAPEASTWKRSTTSVGIGVRSNERQQRLHDEDEDECEAERRLHTLARSLGITLSNKHPQF